MKQNILLRHASICLFTAMEKNDYAIVRVWFVRLYGNIIHERELVDYRPYRRTNHTLTSLLHLYAFAPCTLQDI